MRTAIVVLTSLVTLYAPSALAGSVDLEADGLTAWVPDGWQVTDSGGMTIATAPTEEASAVFVSKPIRDLDLAYRRLGKVVGAIVPGAELGDRKRATIAGSSGFRVDGIATMQSEDGEIELELQILVLATPAQRTLYVVGFVLAERSTKYRRTLSKVLRKIRRRTDVSTGGAGVASKKNLCWEFKGQPNGWRRKAFGGVSLLVPKGWRFAKSKDPDTGTTFAAITNEDVGGSVLVFKLAAGSADEAWRSAVQDARGPYGLGRAHRGKIANQAAICARGSGRDDAGQFTSDAVVVHNGADAFVVLARTADRVNELRAIVGSLRSR